MNDSSIKSSKLDSSILNAKNWLLNSGIQNLSNQKGAFNSWFDIDKQNYPYAYSEITGYGISTLLYLNSLIKENLLIEKSNLAATWIIHKAQHKSGGILTRYFYDKSKFMGSFEDEEIFSFDCGMVLNGLTNLFLITKNRDHLNFCIVLANFIINNMQKKDGSFYALFNSKKNKLIDNGKKWSTQSGAYHTKLSIGFLNLYKITEDKTYKEATEKICNYSLKLLEKNGRIITFRKTKDSLFHPHCYAIEGLYVAGKELNKKKYLTATKKATKFLFNNQLNNGGIPQMYKDNKFIDYERTDILAQSLRVGILHSKEIDAKKLDQLTARLLTLQIFEGNQKGGFIYGYDEFGKKYEHINSWCTMFALQSLIMYKQFKEKRLKINPSLII